MKKGGYIGKLIKAMYGTRSAPLAWQKLVKKTMLELEFTVCVTTPCLYYHKARDIWIVAHVDDFLCSGEPVDLFWVKGELEKRFGITTQMIGPGEHGVYLGRKIQWRADGISIEGENKYITMMAQEWELTSMTSYSTPGCNEDKREEGGDEELSSRASTAFRRTAAMANYMAQDRLDISFASKDISRGISSPTVKDAVKLKRLVRYLMSTRRKAILYKWQDPTNLCKVCVDSDWAGCVKTRRSTSGGVLFLGQHMVHHWSNTQTVVALSSMEAELNAIVKGIAEISALANMLGECGRCMSAQIFTDSSAANGVVHRQGCGKVKHLECRQLWVQEVIACGKVQCFKVPRADNPSDALTHHWSTLDGQRHFRTLSVIDP